VNLFYRSVIATAVLAVIAAACGGGGNNLIDPTVVAPATAEPSSTVQAIPAAIVTPIVVPPSGTDPKDLDLASLIIPVCRTDPFAGDLSGFGTIPRAPDYGTISSTGSLDPDAEIIVALAPIIHWMDHFTAKADAAWELADSDNDFAAVLTEESRRLWLSCNAVALVAPAIETTHPLLIWFKSLLTERQAWLTDRLEMLRTIPDSIRDDDLSRALTSEAIMDLTGSLDVLASDAGMENRVATTAFTVPNPLLEVSLDVPAGWMLIRNRIDIVLTAPVQDQVEGVLGLGVSGWNFGTALRVRRLRHEAPWSLTDTTNLMDSLFARFGERTSEDRRQVDGFETVVRVYASPADRWVTFGAALVRGQHTYLYELGCPSDDLVSCQTLLDELFIGVHFGDG
jgi:NAD(P)-dependent dehydrogenase (short-subunit alcohol dehydrogenase family)